MIAYTNINGIEFPSEYPISRNEDGKVSQMTTAEYVAECKNNLRNGRPYILKTPKDKPLTPEQVKGMKLNLMVKGIQDNGFREFLTLDTITILLLDGSRLVVPGCFRCNAASAPILRQRAIIAGVIHDILYFYRVLSRADCDKVFKIYMRGADNSPRWLCWLFWGAVRLFGKRYYKSDTLI